MGSVLAARLRGVRIYIMRLHVVSGARTEEGGVLLIARVSVTSSVIFEVKPTLINLGGTQEPLLTWQKSLMFHARSPRCVRVVSTSQKHITRGNRPIETNRLHLPTRHKLPAIACKGRDSVPCLRGF